MKDAQRVITVILDGRTNDGRGNQYKYHDNQNKYHVGLQPT